jgi:hypothetical protein
MRDNNNLRYRIARTREQAQRIPLVQGDTIILPGYHYAAILERAAQANTCNFANFSGQCSIGGSFWG